MNGIYERQIAEGRIRSMMREWRAMERAAMADIVYARNHCGPGYLALSWGKQSIVLAHMIHQTNEPDIECVFWKSPTSQWIADFDAVRDEFLSRWPVKYVEFPEGDIDLAGNGTRYLEDNGLDVVFMGLVKIESRARRITLRRATAHNLYNYRNMRWRCCPLADWSDLDVAAYHAKHCLPALAAYRKFGFGMRTSAGVTPGSHAEQGMDMLSVESQSRIREYYAEGGK